MKAITLMDMSLWLATYPLPAGLVLGVLMGLALGWIVTAARFRAQQALAVATVRAEQQLLLDTAGREIATLNERMKQIPALESRLEAAAQDLRSESAVRSGLEIKLAALEEKLASVKREASEKLQVLQDARESLTSEFKLLASDILKDNSREFSEQNEQGLRLLLEPLRSKLGEFQQKVEEVYVAEGKERSALKTEVQQLLRLNQTLSEDAKSLTSALRGSAQSQGSWGEVILERVLEASGLRRDIEYRVQESRATEDGQRQRPDVIICLPEERQLVVDSKLSLLAYERHARAESDAERDRALKEHLKSIRAHLQGLSSKAYQQQYSGLDFVLMFVPIEPAFMLAVTNDEALFMDAWNRNVLLVSPSTLLFVVRTVAHLWRQEAQSRNAQEIAKRGAEFYDRLVGFTEDLEKVGKKLDEARGCFDDASRKLSTGKGNVVRQAEMLRELGVKPGKQLPKSFVDLSERDEELQALPADVGLAGGEAEADETRPAGLG
jgi:DNA recombination protein RmuC